MQPASSPDDVRRLSRPLSPDRHAAVMRRFVERVINNGDYPLLSELIHPDYVYRSPGQEPRDAHAIQELFESYRKGFPDLHIQIDDLIAAEGRVAVAFTLTGTHRGELMGIEPTGKRVRVSGTVFSRFRGGRIIEEWEVLDQLSLLQQLESGFMRPAGSRQRNRNQ